ncbi:unnamed protein product [Amoebophrya sp. A25]|nr:unnamed protein product [Amoebophrya sp. A25]|eukprot:GSA25T00004974001.1
MAVQGALFSIFDQNLLPEPGSGLHTEDLRTHFFPNAVEESYLVGGPAPVVRFPRNKTSFLTFKEQHEIHIKHDDHGHHDSFIVHQENQEYSTKTTTTTSFLEGSGTTGTQTSKRQKRTTFTFLEGSPGGRSSGIAHQTRKLHQSTSTSCRTTTRRRGRLRNTAFFVDKFVGNFVKEAKSAVEYSVKKIGKDLNDLGKEHEEYSMWAGRDAAGGDDHPDPMAGLGRAAALKEEAEKMKPDSVELEKRLQAAGLPNEREEAPIDTDDPVSTYAPSEALTGTAYAKQMPSGGFTYENLQLDRAASYRNERTFATHCDNKHHDVCELVRPGVGGSGRKGVGPSWSWGTDKIGVPNCYRTAISVYNGQHNCNCRDQCGEPEQCPAGLCALSASGDCRFNSHMRKLDPETLPLCSCAGACPPLRRCPVEFAGQQVCAEKTVVVEEKNDGEASNGAAGEAGKNAPSSAPKKEVKKCVEIPGARTPFSCSCEGVCSLPDCPDAKCEFTQVPTSSSGETPPLFYCGKTPQTMKEEGTGAPACNCRERDELCGGNRRPLPLRPKSELLKAYTNGGPLAVFGFGLDKLKFHGDHFLEAATGGSAPGQAPAYTEALRSIQKGVTAGKRKAMEALGYKFGTDPLKPLKDENGELKTVDFPSAHWILLSEAVKWQQVLSSIDRLAMMWFRIVLNPILDLFASSPLGTNAVLRGAAPDVIRDFVLSKSGALRGGSLNAIDPTDLASATLTTSSSKSGEVFGSVLSEATAKASSSSPFPLPRGVQMVGTAMKSFSRYLSEGLGVFGAGAAVHRDPHHGEKLSRPDFFRDSQAILEAAGDIQAAPGGRGTGVYPYGISRKTLDPAEMPLDTSNEPQLLLFHKSKSILATDIANANEFSCWATGETTPVGRTRHPWIKFDRPLHRIHVRLQDMQTHDVKWDAIYNLHGTDVLKPNAAALGGTRPDMWTFCIPPAEVTPHNFILDVRMVGTGFAPLDGYRSFLGSALVQQFTPSHAPESYAFQMPTANPKFPNFVGSVIEGARKNREWEAIKL